MAKASGRAELRGQLSLAGIIIGCVGCVIITASSVYTALKMGALPWPTIFTSITALVLLRALGKTSLNEANITQVIMSAGSMVAGGLAFTIPGIWILGLTEQVSWWQMLAVALAGTLLGLVCTALIHKHFVEESTLEYPIGAAAAQTLLASRAGGATGKKLFGAMAVAGVWAIARDVLHLMPSLIAPVAIPGVAMGIQNSPMRLAVGFLVGRRSMIYWIVGGFLGWFGIVWLGSTAGLWSLDGGHDIVSSLGMGLMMGSGAGVVIKDILLPLVRSRRARRSCAADARDTKAVSGAGASAFSRFTGIVRKFDAGLLGLLAAIAALLMGMLLKFDPLVCVVIVALSFVTAIMSAQSVGQSGIDPMEIFGLIVLLAVAAFANVAQIQLFFVAGVVAVACGLAGDVMSDFKTGQIIGTDPRVMWMGQAIGALLGAVVAVAVMVALVGAYGPHAFGGDAMFVAAQANVVATMVAGIPCVPAFAIGLIAGAVLYLVGIPSMMVGLGVYLPFFMTFTTVFGCGIRWVYDRICAARGLDQKGAEETGVVIASGLLGGESIIGVIVAFATVAAGLMQ